MTCPKCNSENVSTQIVTDMKLKNAHHGIIWWLCIGWWWVGFKWLFLTIPALLAKIFIPKKQKLVTKQRTMCVCQNCGHTWQV
jgi:transcription elongation factor Elf1